MKKRKKGRPFFLFKIKIEAIRCVRINQTQPSMNPIQELQIPSLSTPFSPRFVCPPPPRAFESVTTWSSASSPTKWITMSDGFQMAVAEASTSATTRFVCPPPPPASETNSSLEWPSATSPTFRLAALPTWTLPSPPGSRSGAAAPTGGEPTHSWADVVLPTEPESIRHLTTLVNGGAYAEHPSRQAVDIVHPDTRRILIRQRGSYWWHESQDKLEQQFSSGERQPVEGGFYVFLEEEQSGNIVRFGNVFTSASWWMQTVAFPKGHPDADVPPYQMIDVRE